MTQDDKALIGIIMGSDSDWETLEATTKICDDFSLIFLGFALGRDKKNRQNHNNSSY